MPFISSRQAIRPQLATSSHEVHALLTSARALPADGSGARLLQGRHLAWLAEAPGGASAEVFAMAASALGATVVHVRPGALLRADARETVRMLCQLYGVIGCDGLDPRAAAQLARWSSVPVLDTIAADTHPTRLLGDLLVMCEHSGKPPDEIVLCVHALAPSPLGAAWRRLSASCGLRFAACDGDCPRRSCSYRIEAATSRGGSASAAGLLAVGGSGATAEPLVALQREGHARIVQALLTQALA